MHWEPIKDLPSDWKKFVSDELQALAQVWDEQGERLRASEAYREFLARLQREIAIETGIIERIYTIDRGITQLLVEKGIDEALIPHGATDKDAKEVVAIISDHAEAVEGLFQFVKGARPFSLSYIRELHATLTRHQKVTTGIDQFGNLQDVALIRGAWKQQPNNPLRDGEVHEYCPPEQVQIQMEQLIRWHEEHESKGVTPEIEAAWLHHRFTQIHPFQDGNGRVARMLASLVFIKAGWFPLVVRREDRSAYIRALEAADGGDLSPLVRFFTRAQKHAFIQSLSLAEETLRASRAAEIIKAAAQRLRQDLQEEVRQSRMVVERYAKGLLTIAKTQLELQRDEIDRQISELMPLEVFVDLAAPMSGRSDYFKYQIIETAKGFGYYANFREYRSWVRLVIKIGDSQTELLVSFHALGREYKGVVACSACAYHKALSDEERGSHAQHLQALSDAPFQLSYADREDKLKQRFAAWLSEVIVVGLEYWRKGL